MFITLKQHRQYYKLNNSKDIIRCLSCIILCCPVYSTQRPYSHKLVYDLLEWSFHFWIHKFRTIFSTLVNNIIKMCNFYTSLGVILFDKINHFFLCWLLCCNWSRDGYLAGSYVLTRFCAHELDSSLSSG